MSDGITVTGLDTLNAKLKNLEQGVAAKAIRSAAMTSTTQTKKKMQAAAPRGSRAHKTYKGRLVSPGFLSRSVARKSRVDKRKGAAVVTIGVRPEAFYGVTFLDDGQTVTQRRVSNGGRRRKTVKVGPYTLKAHRWFRQVFERDAQQIVDNFGRRLKIKIEQAAQ